MTNARKSQKTRISGTLDRKQARSGLSPIPAARRDTVSISRGLDFYCFSCGSPVELTVETIMKRAAPCNYCGGEVILHHRLRPDLLQINEKFIHAGGKPALPYECTWPRTP